MSTTVKTQPGVNGAILQALGDVRRKIRDATDEIAALEARQDAGALERVDRLRTHIARLDAEETRLAESLKHQEAIQASHRQEYGRMMARGAIADAAANGTLGTEDGAELGAPTEHTERRGPYVNTLTGDVRGRAHRAVGRFDGAPEGARSRLLSLLERSYREPDGERFAKQIAVTSSDAYRSAFAEVLSSDHPILTDAEARALRDARDVQRAMGLTDPSGGFMVPAPLDPALIVDDPGVTSPIRRLARSVTATSSTWRGVTSSAVSASFDAEASEVSDDSPTLDEILITIRAMRVFVPFSFEVAEDAPGFEGELIRLMREAKTDLEARVFWDGIAANNEPIGLLTALVAAGSPIVDTATAATLASTDLGGLYNALGPRWRDRSTWMADAGIVQNIASYTNDSAIELPPLPTSLYGRPIALNTVMDGTVATGNYVVVLGDFGQYIVANRVGMTVSRVPFLFGATGYPTGQGGLFGWARLGAQVAVADAFRVLRVQ